MEETITTIKINKENYIKTKQKLLEENKTFKEWINEKIKEYAKNGTKKTKRN